MSRFPWWGSILLAILFYYGLKHGIPKLITPENTLYGLLPQLAPLVAMGFLLLAGKQLYDDTGKMEPTSEQQERNQEDPGHKDS